MPGTGTPCPTKRVGSAVPVADRKNSVKSKSIAPAIGSREAHEAEPAAREPLSREVVDFRAREAVRATVGVPFIGKVEGERRGVRAGGPDRHDSALVIGVGTQDREDVAAVDGAGNHRVRGRAGVTRCRAADVMGARGAACVSAARIARRGLVSGHDRGQRVAVIRVVASEVRGARGVVAAAAAASDVVTACFPPVSPPRPRCHSLQPTTPCALHGPAVARCLASRCSAAPAPGAASRIRRTAAGSGATAVARRGSRRWPTCRRWLTYRRLLMSHRLPTCAARGAAAASIAAIARPAAPPLPSRPANPAASAPPLPATRGSSKSDFDLPHASRAPATDHTNHRILEG